MEVIEILTGGTEVIGRISAEWTLLSNEGASSAPFFRPEWFTTFVRNFEKKVDIVTVRLDGKLSAVLPLSKKRGTLHGLPVRKLQSVFNLNTQRFDLIHGNETTNRREIVQAIWRTIRETPGWDVLEFRLVKRDSWLGDVLELAEKENYLTGVWQMDSAPFITLPRSDDKQQAIADFFKGSRKHLRQELDRRLRRLRELGSVEFVVSTEATPEVMQTYFDLESKGWKGRGGTAVTDDPLVAQMHREFASEVADRRSLFIYQLKLDGRTIAMSLNIRYGDETIHWKTSYDEEFSRYSPGNLLFRELVSDCIRDGSTEIDFLSPSTPNKRFWATGEREHAAFYVFRRGIIGTLLWAWKFKLISRLRRLRSENTGVLVPAHAEK